MNEASRDSDRREYFRIQTHARVSLRVLLPEELEEARARARSPRLPAVLASGGVEERGMSPEGRSILELLRPIALTLERMDRRMNGLVTRDSAVERIEPQLASISLSASGSAMASETDFKPGTLVAAELELRETGLSAISVVARVLETRAGEDGEERTSFHFTDILEEDREKIIRFGLKHQTKELRQERLGGAS